VSLRSPYLLPKVALVDPELTFSMPREVTASTGMDALTQLIEPFVSPQANPLTDAVCREGMRRAARSLLRAYHDGRDREARVDMALASLLSGLALANAKLGVAHGFASVLGGMLEASHGAICARLLAPAMTVNLSALQSRGTDEGARGRMRRFEEVARILTSDPNARAGQGIEQIHEMADRLEIPYLASYGLREEQFPEVIEKTAQASSTQGNPIQLTAPELGAILGQAL
jgi:alcohol dehydrogenase class IV